jgi:hypothetical protein
MASYAAVPKFADESLHGTQVIFCNMFRGRWRTGLAGKRRDG